MPFITVILCFESFICLFFWFYFGFVRQILHDDNNEVQAIFFQDARMKAHFENYPDMMMFDGTYNLNDRRMPLVIALVIDGNGESQIAALFMVKSENAQAFNFLFENFKIENPQCVKTTVIVTDKGLANRNCVTERFPDCAHHFCIFHVGQIFQREITTQK